MKVSVGIVTYKRPEYLNVCLASLMPCVSQIAQVIIATNDQDNESINDGTRQLLRALQIAGVSVEVLVSSNLVHSKLLIGEASKAEVVLILDDDAVVGERYMDLVHHFGRPDVGAVSGTIQTPINPGYKDWSQEPVDFPEDLKVCNRMVVVDGVIQWLDKYQFYMHKSGPSVIGADFLGGTALFVRRELVQLWDLQSIREGGDGEWVIEGEEIDFCLSVRKLGYGLIYDASRICWHLFARSGRVRGSNYDQRIENWNYILGKHGFPLIDHYPSVWEKDLPPEWQPKS